ncbi:MAG: T9SS type A sorting domain-containing protein [Candidatus Cloacimonetes bacterium]|nr:T9SS type A sorting domain-containing protein [Candidatus Cloacimonadota bacterium]
MRFRILAGLLLIPVALLMSFTIEIADFSEAVETNPVILQAGAPSIPYISVKYLLAMGEEFDRAEISYTGSEQELSIVLDPVQQPQPLSQEFIEYTAPDMSIYGSSAIYPESGYKVVSTQRKNGYDILYLHLYPWRYDPAAELVNWHETAEIEIFTHYSEAIYLAQSAMLTTENPVFSGQNLYNQTALASYIKGETQLSRTLADPSEPYSMILITSTAAGEWFGDYLDWKMDHGLETGIFYTEDIYAEYEGANNQAKIKNFINDAYMTWSGTDSPLEYVILGGDDEIIPIRGIYINAGGTIDNNLPCDLYYSCLDNDWDGNENGIYGEVSDDVDLVPELSIGRLPFDNEQDMINWFNKVTHYVDDNTYSNNICTLVGESLNNNPQTWGGDAMDFLLEEIDEPFQVNTLYEREGTYSEYGVTMAINEGAGFLNHLGHSNEGFVFGQTRPSAADYYNTEYGFGYSQGCYPAAFDEATGQTSECIVENFIIRPAGFFEFIGNSRYGWYSPGQPASGPSQQYHLPFMQAIFTYDLREFGKALAYSREVMADAAIEYSHLRWVHYELTLMGDPSISLKVPNPDFPFIAPEEPIYTDTEGDGDGAINPGETIEITIPLTADADWADAEDVNITIQFEDSAVSTETETIYYGSIASGETITSEPIIVYVPADCSYDAYPYTITVMAPVGTESEFVKSYSFDFEVSIQQTNWPWFLAERLSVAPIITDLDGDGVFDILATTMAGDMYGIDLYAEEMDGYHWETGETIENQTAFGDVDADGEDEIVLATRAGNIYARNLDGSLAYEYVHGADQLLTPVLTDIDGDGLLEVISYGMDGNLIVLDENGESEMGFPLPLGIMCFQEMAAADIDGDGGTDIAIATLDGQLHVIKYNGMEVAGFPVALGSNPGSGVTILANHNLALGTSDRRLLVISSTGEIITDKELSSNIVSSPIAADFDGDEELELAFTTRFGDVYICEQNGDDLPGWPHDSECSISQPPLAVDIDNENGIDLIWFAATNTLFVYNNDGTEIDFSPVPVNYNDNFPASIADLDNDLDYEIVFSTSNRVIVIDSKLRKGSEAPWSTFRGNLCRTGFYGDNQLTDNEITEVAPAGNVLMPNYPNPFNPSTTISFFTTEGTESAEINIYNIKGQQVQSFKIDDGRRESGVGRRSVVWDGKDKSGKAVASGVYFYRLKIDNKICDSQRMLLLK